MNEKKIYFTEFIEAHCPYCRYVEVSILRDIIVRRDELSKKLVKRGYLPLPILELKLVDVEANQGSKEMQWFQQYSRKIGGVYTPAIRVGDSGKVFYLWGKDKEEAPSAETLSSTEKLKRDLILEVEHIITSVEKKPRFYDKDFFNPKAQVQKPRVPVKHTPYGGFL